jgi:hypothetical protein
MLSAFTAAIGTSQQPDCFAAARGTFSTVVDAYTDEEANIPAFSIMRQKEHMPGAEVGWPHREHGCKALAEAARSENRPCLRASRNRR